MTTPGERPTLHLICGLPGSGKTTLGEQLERRLHALRLVPDVWMARIVGDGYDAERRRAVEALQLEIALKVLALGVDVIWENGGWSRAERDAVRAEVAARGGATKLHFLDAPLDELVRRLERRNAALPPDTFAVTADDLRLWSTGFERPTAEELD